MQPYVLGRQQKVVWQRAGVSASWLSTRKKGTTAISADDIYVLAKGLQCDLCDFYAPEVDVAPIPSREDREPLPPGAQELVETYEAVRALLTERLSPPAAELASNVLDFLKWQEERQQRLQTQQWRKEQGQPETVNDVIPKRR